MHMIYIFNFAYQRKFPFFARLRRGLKNPVTFSDERLIKFNLGKRSPKRKK